MAREYVPEWQEDLFEFFVESSAGDGGLDPEAQKHEAPNFLRHVVSLSASKIADGLIDPKLVLSWLLSHLGAGAGLTGLLVPIRESGALLPQLFTAGAIRGMARRKWAWAAGAAGQGLSAAGMVLAALTLDGKSAGVAIVILLGVLALCRSVCSASYKDVLGKTVGKSRRGAATGAASSAASVGVIVFALVLLTGWGDRFVIVLAAMSLAAVAWIVGALMFSRLEETASPREGGLSGWEAVQQLRLLQDRPQLRRFVIVRTFLVGTALAPPYLVVLSSQGDTGALAGLGALVLASSGASLVSSWVWGRMSDRSSRWVLMLSGVAGATALGLALLVWTLGFAGTVWAMPVVLFGLMVAYHGVRQGRSTHLVDMAGPDDRAAYTAVANTAVGAGLLVAGGAFAGVAAVSVPLVIGVFAVMCLVGAWLALGLDEVQGD